MQADTTVAPHDQKQNGLIAPRGGVPDQSGNIPHAIIDAKLLKRHAGVYEMGHQQQWNDQPQDDLGGFPKWHAQGTPFCQPPKGQTRVHQKRRI